jgi:hypothetical protein
MIMLGTVDLLTAYLGDRLGLYALAERGPLTSTGSGRDRDARAVRARVARAAAVSGASRGNRRGPGVDLRRYLLPDGHAEVLLDRQSQLPARWRGCSGFMAPLRGC